jgi:hypothetical protein
MLRALALNPRKSHEEMIQKATMADKTKKDNFLDRCCGAAHFGAEAEADVPFSMFSRCCAPVMTLMTT